MPRRVKVDREPILRVFEKVGTAKETAVVLGLHYNTVVQILRLDRGFCMRCGRNVCREGFTKCAVCAEWERVRTAEKRRKARAKRQCSMCPSPLRKGSTLYCEEHYHSTFDRQQAHRFMSKYGPNALEAWRRAAGHCESCGKSRSAQKLNLHHIDEDYANQAIENFAVICFSCHRTAHFLIESPNRKALIAWFEKTYPDKALR